MTSLTGTIFELFQLATPLVALIAVIMEFRTAQIKSKKYGTNIYWLFIVPLLLVFVHHMIFYIFLIDCRYLGDCDTSQTLLFTKWSVVRSFHLWLTVLFMSYMRYKLSRRC